MRQERFVQAHAQEWQELETLTRQNLTDITQVSRFYRCYQDAARHLSYAQTHFPASSVCTYLNTLLTTAHHKLSPGDGRRRGGPGRFFFTTLPQKVWANKYPLLLAFGVFFAGFLYAYLFTHFQPSSAGNFLPQEFLGAGEGGGQAVWDAPVMSSQILVNNVMVSITAFAYGITLGLGTVYVLWSNGLMLGSLAALYVDRGLGAYFWSLILPHGVIELFAIFLSGAAGLCMARALLRPGRLRRGDALKLNLKSALHNMLLVALLLTLAAVIEGFFTPSEVSVSGKLIFAGVTGLLLLCYLLLGARRIAPVEGEMWPDSSTAYASSKDTA